MAGVTDEVVFRSVVVGTDGSQTAQRAVTTATGLARALAADLHVVCAHNPMRGVHAAAAPGYIGAAELSEASAAVAQEVVDAAVAAVRLTGVGVHGHAIVGDPVSALLDVAGRENADLIVVGSRGMHGIKRALGSVPNTISHRAPCSVLIVSTDAPD